MGELTIRSARVEDVPAITDIYNDAVLNTTATFDTEPLSVENRIAWFKNRTKDFPVIVAAEAGRVVAYAALNRWSDRKAYDISAELSLYVEAEHRGRLIGKRLYVHILELALSTGLYTIILRITADNDVSLGLARRAGFQDVGVLRRCGTKFDRVLDVVLLQKILK